MKGFLFFADALLLGDWECASGSRDIDCGQGVVVADLALGPPDVLRFTKGTATNLLLLIPSRAIVPSLGGPTCELAFDGAFLHAESTCLDDQSQAVVVHQGSAQLGLIPGQFAVNITATTSKSCNVQTQALCYSVP
ncbi:MAG TPA: hypothetical protein VGL59_00610 [Polyangia bacterium]|jgi:hypothetical protein